MDFLGLEAENMPASRPPYIVSVDYERPKNHPEGVIFVTDQGNIQTPVFHDLNPVMGTLTVDVAENQSLEVHSAKIEFCGLIRSSLEKREKHTFLHQSLTVRCPKVMQGVNKFPFSFACHDVKSESFIGKDVWVRYYLRVTLATPFFSPDISKCFEIWVQKPLKQRPAWIRSVAALDSSKLFYGEKSILIQDHDVLVVLCYLEKKVFAIGEERNVPLTVEIITCAIEMKDIRACLVRRETAFLPKMKQTTDAELISIPLVGGDKIQGTNTTRYKLDFSEGKVISPTLDLVENVISVQYFVQIVVTSKSRKEWRGEHEVIFWRPYYTPQVLRQGMEIFHNIPLGPLEL